MPKKIALLTEFVNIGTAGFTRDKREIQESWLEEMAACYDPEEFVASINPDHMEWYGSLGQVRELRVATDKKGRKVLQARLEPNERLLYMNSQKQRLFLSMEVDTDFCKSGKAYLVGLSITDNPASVGTTELRFSAQASANNNFIAEPVEVPAAAFSVADDPAPDDSKLFSMLKTLIGKREKEKGNEDMITPEQFKALTDAQEAQTKAIKDLVEKFGAAVTPPAPKNPETPETPKTPAGTGTPAPEKPEGGSQGNEYKTLLEKQEKFAADLAELKSTIETAIAAGKGTEFGKQTGDAGGKAVEVL